MSRTSCAPRSPPCGRSTSCSRARPVRTPTPAQSSSSRVASRSSGSIGWRRTCSSCPSWIQGSSCSSCGRTTFAPRSNRPWSRPTAPHASEASGSPTSSRTNRSGSGTTRQRIGQVVTNLVLNAIKFTPKGGSVEVRLAPAGSGARIDVIDTGVGIDAAELPHIFERFYRGSQANEARGSGSGLGLAIVRSIVDMHGGAISVESQVGAGSRFTVTLPPDPRMIAGTPAAQQAAVELDTEGGSPSIVDAAPGFAARGPVGGREEHSGNFTDRRLVGLSAGGTLDHHSPPGERQPSSGPGDRSASGDHDHPMSDPQNPNPYESNDPADQTQRHALPPAPGESGRYTPAPESRPDWAERATWPSQTHQPTQERWYEPATPAPATSVTPERPRRAQRGGHGRRRGTARRGPRVRRHGRRAQRDRCLPAIGPAGLLAGRSDRLGAPAGHHRRGLGDHRRRRLGRPGRRQDHDQRQRRDRVRDASRRPASAPASSTTRTAGSSPTATSSRAATRSRSSSRTVASSRARSTASTR